MGYHRLFLWTAILVPVFAVADWGQTDSAFLQLISGNVSALKANSDAQGPTLSGMASDLSSAEALLQSVDDSLVDIAISVDDIPGISGDVGNIASDVDYIRQYTYSLDSSVTDACLSLQAIYDAVDAIQSDVDKFQFANQSSQVEQYNHRSVYVHDVRADDIDYKLGLFGSALTNQLNVLNASVNNLTNFVFASPGGVYTNLAALLAVPNGNANFSPRFFYYYLFGRYPTQSEINSLNNLWKDFGIINLPYYDYFFRLSTDELTSWPGYNSFYWEVIDNLGYDTPVYHQMANAYYYQYGTRPLVDSLNVLSNSLFSVNGEYLSRSSSSSGTSWGLGATASSALHGIKESASFTGEVGTNIVGSVLKGPINPIADNDFNSSLSDIKESTPQSFTDLDGVLSEINGVKGTADDIVDLLDNADHNNDFVISGDIAMSHIGSHTLSITIPNQTARMGPIVNFFCVCMEFFMLIYFVSVAWDDVVQVVFGRRLM